MGVGMNKLVCGIGFNGRKYPTYINDTIVEEYEAWRGMLRRCAKEYWVKFPTYTGTTCSENFKSYSFFYEWCQEQVGFGNKDEGGRCWQLDKDLLINMNKLYSEDTCVFVPQRINLLLIKRKASRGEWSVGVNWNKRDKKFQSSCSTGHSKKKNLGSFNTPEEAFQAYKVYKEQVIKQVANEYKEQLDQRVYNALMNYEVNIND